MNILEKLAENPIIAAIRSDRDLTAAWDAPPPVWFLLNANILTLPGQIEAAHRCGKSVFVHLDLAEGLGKDHAGTAYLSRLGADGVISTRSSVIRSAKLCGLCAVQRFFMVDSHSVATAAESIHTAQPDLVELMPGIIPKVVQRFSAECDVPVIAGGLIDSKSEILAALRAGAAAVSTGDHRLWSE